MKKNIPLTSLWNSRILIILWVGMFCFSGCSSASQENQKETEVETPKQEKECDPAENVAELYQAIIDLPELQQYYPVDEVKERGTLVLQQNNAMPAGLTLTGMGKPVEILSAESIESRGITAFLVIEKLDFNDRGDSGKLELSYKTQGLYLTGEMRFEDCQWNGVVRLEER